MELTVQLKDGCYPIYIEEHILEKVNTYVSQVFQGRRIMIISDDHVFPIYGSKIEEELLKSYQCSHVVIPHGETSKSFDTLPDVYAGLLEHQISRSDLIIALGGGVVGDLTGFVAATYLRGVSLIQIPTSLLAQVDSSVGGKVAVDLPQGKNLVGAFYHPKMVLIDPTVLHTLPEHFIADGMGEVIKYGCIEDKKLYEMLLKKGSYQAMQDCIDEVIYRCVDCKRRIVEEDEHDFGKRMLLNFGHTLAHTIEQYYHYERESHGEAVAIGMYQLTKMTEEMGLTEKGTAAQIKELLSAYQLPYQCNQTLDVLLDAIKLDKKNINNHLHLILLKQIGDSYIYETDTSFFETFKDTII
ncbi:MAG: 3-dehydroquinate synthase [Hespellia sp.]|nr:3-dehydroquinate synthase [Hespellia sp.]